MAVKYKWLAERLREMIRNKQKEGTDRMPTELELTRRYHVSRQTVRQALRLLEEEKLIEKRQGSGTYITGLIAGPLMNTIAVLVSMDKDYIYPGILEDIQDRLGQNGFFTKIYVTENKTEKERQILSELLKNPPRGILAEGCKSALPNPNLDLYRKLKMRKIPVLFLHNYYPGLSSPLFVKDDNYQGSQLLTEYLLSLGHTSIGAAFKRDDLQGMERFQGFMETMRNAGHPVADWQVGWFDSWDQEGLLLEKDREFLKKIIKTSLKTCTAVICYNDLIAYHLIAELQDMGFYLPKDMAVAAFDNTYLSNSQALSITSLSHQRHEIGKKAAQGLLDTIKGLPVKSLEVPWQLSKKASTP